MLVAIAFWSLMTANGFWLISLFVKHVVKDDERETSETLRGFAALAYLIGSILSTWVIIDLYLHR
jgi:hypothetical protein